MNARELHIKNGVNFFITEGKIVITFNDKPKTYSLEHVYYDNAEKHIITALYKILSVFSSAREIFKLTKEEDQDAYRITDAVCDYLYGKPDRIKKGILFGDENYCFRKSEMEEEPLGPVLISTETYHGYLDVDGFPL